MRSIEITDIDTLAQNVLRIEDVRPVLASLEARGLGPVALKGLGLLSTIYASDLGARPMSDVDLLILPEHLAEAERILLEGGFSRVPQHQHTFRGGRGDTRIDLATEVWYLDPLELRAFASRSQAGEFDGLHLRVPAIEDHLFFIAIHAVVLHGQIRPAWAEDLRRLVSLQPDWTIILANARRFGLTVPLGCALEHAAALGAVIPPEVTGALRPRGADRLVAKVVRSFLDRPETHETGHILRFLFRRGPRAKARGVLRQLFPGLQFIRRRYGTQSNTVAIARCAWRPASTAVRTFRYALRSLSNSRVRRRIPS